MVGEISYSGVGKKKKEKREKKGKEGKRRKKGGKGEEEGELRATEANGRAVRQLKSEDWRIHTS